MGPLPAIGTAIALLILLGGVELLYRRGSRAETTRREAHAIGTCSTVVLPFYLSLVEVVTLAGMFAVVLAGTQYHGSLRSIHGARRLSLGAPLLPCGIALAAIVAWGHPAGIAYAVLVLGLADPAASLAGERFGLYPWRVPGGRKTVSGSLAFGGVAIVIGLGLSIASGNGRVPEVLAAALVLTLAEGSIGFGLDNVAIPVLAGLIGRGWLSL